MDQLRGLRLPFVEEVRTLTKKHYNMMFVYLRFGGSKHRNLLSEIDKEMENLLFNRFAPGAYVGEQYDLQAVSYICGRLHDVAQTHSSTDAYIKELSVNTGTFFDN